MPLKFTSADDYQWSVRKIAVVGPGIVGMPMAALLAHAAIRIGTDQPAHVVVLQRASATSGWKVAAINRGESVIGGVEPALDEITRESVRAGRLSASHDYAAARDADVVLVSVQTDKRGFGPDYGPLFDALEGLAAALRERPPGNVPVVCFESTLAPSSMQTLVREFFAKRGLEEGRDILLGNSPNRVMPGRLVERVAGSDKLVAGLHPLTPKLIATLYSHIVTKGSLHSTNSTTAEVVKTLENAYRDVRIAFAAEIVRYCDAHDIDFYAVREAVNARLAQSDAASGSATAVPSGALLVPTVGVGGHCLPKDGILLWWRRIESGADTSNSLILESRRINDASPAATLTLAERDLGSLEGRRIALLGVAYRFDSEDTRNSPTLALARLLAARGIGFTLHDPYVRPGDQNLERAAMAERFTNDLGAALAVAELAIVCTGHGVYARDLAGLHAAAPKLSGIVDAANVWRRADVEARGLAYTGIGRGRKPPLAAFVDFVQRSFEAVERGVADEVAALGSFLNERYARDVFNEVRFETVRAIAATCPTGCAIVAAGQPITAPVFEGFRPHLACCAQAARATA